MKILLALILTTATFPALAEMDLAKAKAEHTANLDKRIANLNEAKNCVNGAATKEAMQTCHQQLKSEHMEMRTERMEKRKNKLQEKLKKMEEKKSEESGS